MKLSFWNNFIVILGMLGGVTTVNTSNSSGHLARATITMSTSKSITTYSTVPSKELVHVIFKAIGTNDIARPQGNVIKSVSRDQGIKSGYKALNHTRAQELKTPSTVITKDMFLLPEVKGDLYPRLNPNYSPPISRSVPIKIEAIPYTSDKPRFISTESKLFSQSGANKELIPLSPSDYKVVAIINYEDNQVKILANSIFSSKIIDKFIYIPNKTSSLEVAMDKKLPFSFIGKSEMNSFLTYTNTNWKSFIFEGTKNVQWLIRDAKIYSNIENLYVRGIGRLHYMIF